MHVWNCSNHLPAMRQLVFNCKKSLVKLMRTYTNNKSFNDSILYDRYLWTWEFHHSQWCFIDLIKGFIPVRLYDIIHHETNNTKLTNQILSNFIHYVYTTTIQLIWTPRIERQLVDEYHAGINRKIKLKKKSYNPLPTPMSTHRSSNNISYEFLGISSFIDFGGSWLSNFQLVVSG
jgi:hypothetical protein